MNQTRIFLIIRYSLKHTQTTIVLATSCNADVTVISRRLKPDPKLHTVLLR